MNKEGGLLPLYREGGGPIVETYIMGPDGYYVAYKPITLSCILFMFIEMKYIHYHYRVMFEMKYKSMYND